MGAVTSLSHSRSRIFIEGRAAAEVLAKGIPLDFHPTVFTVGQFALTGLHHTPVLVHHSGETRYEIYAMRTFALSVWEWLTDAALPVGFDVEAKGQ
jgi:sarcosine oxidase subunit gamma